MALGVTSNVSDNDTAVTSGVFDAELLELPRDALDTLTRLPSEMVARLVEVTADDLVRDRLVGTTSTAQSALSEALKAEYTVISQNEANGGSLVNLQTMYALVCSILVRMARDNLQSEHAQWQALRDLGIENEEFLGRFQPLVMAAVPKVQCVLEQTRFDFAHVVDVSWRLDYALRSSTAGTIHSPLCFVQLKLQTPAGKIERLEFSCSVEELRDLVYRLQEAVNEIEKFAATPSTRRA